MGDRKGTPLKDAIKNNFQGLYFQPSNSVFLPIINYWIVFNFQTIMCRTDISKKYIEYLEKGEMQKVISLFSKNGKVISPLYGEKKAKDFYEELGADTIQSQLKINGIFEEKKRRRVALYFDYIWTMKNRKTVQFEVVDILEFDEKNKIEILRIIYDTVKSRELIQELKNKN